MSWNDLQLKFDLEGLDEVKGDAELRSISQAEARQISEAARIAFEAKEYADPLSNVPLPGWMEDYIRLREMGWPWRVAAYIAWAASPRSGRWPRSLAELADKVLGLRSPRVIHIWRENHPSIDTIVAVMQAAPLLEHKRDVIEALVSNASEADYKTFNDRKLFLEMVGLYTPKSKLEVDDRRAKDLSELSDEELDALSGESLEKRLSEIEKKDPSTAQDDTAGVIE